MESNNPWISLTSESSPTEPANEDVEPKQANSSQQIGAAAAKAITKKQGPTDYTIEKSHIPKYKWIEYGPSNRDGLMEAASGTYLNRDFDNGLFFLNSTYLALSLLDPDTGEPSNMAQAFIRLDSDKKVADIYGRQPGARLDDPIVPVVINQVQDLPNGEEYLVPLKNSRRVAEIYTKWDRGGRLTDEDSAFLIPDNLPTEYNSLNISDKRVFALQRIAIPLKLGFKANEVLPHLDIYDVSTYCDDLLKHGANPNQIVSRFIDEEHYYTILGHLCTLQNYGAKIDPENVLNKLSDSELIRVDTEELKDLIDSGADKARIISRLDPYIITQQLDLLTKYINIDDLVKRFSADDIVFGLNELTRYGAKINMAKLIQEFTPSKTPDYDLQVLLEHGADLNQLLERLTPEQADYVNFCLVPLLKRRQKE